MIPWILDHHHFLIGVMVAITILVLLIRDFYRSYKEKRKLQRYKWDRLILGATLVYMVGTALFIGIMLGGQVLHLP